MLKQQKISSPIKQYVLKVSFFEKFLRDEDKGYYDTNDVENNVTWVSEEKLTTGLNLKSFDYNRISP